VALEAAQQARMLRLRWPNVLSVRRNWSMMSLPTVPVRARGNHIGARSRAVTRTTNIIGQRRRIGNRPRTGPPLGPPRQRILLQALERGKRLRPTGEIFKIALDAMSPGGACQPAVKDSPELRLQLEAGSFLERRAKNEVGTSELGDLR